MVRSSTLGNAASILGGWMFVAICLIGSVVYFDELRAVGRWALGVPDPDQTVVRRTAISAQAEAGGIHLDEQRQPSSSKATASDIS